MAIVKCERYTKGGWLLGTSAVPTNICGPLCILDVTRRDMSRRKRGIICGMVCF